MGQTVSGKKLRTEDELGKRVGDSPLARLLRVYGTRVLSEASSDVAPAAPTVEAA